VFIKTFRMQQDEIFKSHATFTHFIHTPHTITLHITVRPPTIHHTTHRFTNMLVRVFQVRPEERDFVLKRLAKTKERCDRTLGGEWWR